LNKFNSQEVAERNPFLDALCCSYQRGCAAYALFIFLSICLQSEALIKTK